MTFSATCSVNMLLLIRMISCFFFFFFAKPLEMHVHYAWSAFQQLLGNSLYMKEYMNDFNILLKNTLWLTTTSIWPHRRRLQSPLYLFSSHAKLHCFPGFANRSNTMAARLSERAGLRLPESCLISSSQ